MFEEFRSTSAHAKAGPDPSKLTSFFEKQTERSIYEDCLLWGTRDVVPTACRDAVLTELHEGHPGINRIATFAPCHPASNDIDFAKWSV